MTLRVSTGARTFMAGIGSFKDAFQDGRIEIYSGAQPLTADAAVTGTLLCTITGGGLAHTPAVLSSGSVSLAGAAGSVNSITVNGLEILGAAVPFAVSLTQTALNVVAQINEFHSATEYVASALAGVVTITALPGSGVSPNGLVVAATSTTLTATPTNMAGGVAAVNGLKFGAPSAAAISKSLLQTWSGAAVAAGAAGYYRMYGCVADAGALDAAGTFIREDGAILAGSGEMPMTSTTTAVGVPIVVSALTRTLPTL